MSETVINTEEFQNNKSSRGGCGKVLLWLLFIAFLLSCLCCCGLCGIGYYIESALNKGLVDDPVVAQEKAVENYGEFNLPDYVKPRAYFEMRMFGKYFGFACIYTLNDENDDASTELDEISKEGESDIFEIFDGSQNLILFYTLSPEFTKGYDSAVAEGMAKAISDPQPDQPRNWKTNRCETVSVTINGQPTELTCGWIESIYGDHCLVISGFFKTTKDTPCGILVIMPGEPEKESVIKALENIQ